LKKLCEVYNTAIVTAKILSPPTREDQEKRENKYAQEMESLLTKFDNVISTDSMDENDCFTSLCFPGPVKQEKDGVRKVLAHLLRAVGAIATTNLSLTTSSSNCPRKRKSWTT